MLSAKTEGWWVYSFLSIIELSRFNREWSKSPYPTDPNNLTLVKKPVDFDRIKVRKRSPTNKIMNIVAKHRTGRCSQK